MATEMLGTALRQIDRLFADGTVTGLSDDQLLEQFVGRRDATAFEGLVARHGPMVLSVCRGILHDSNDAEDAFQATFLVLIKKAGSIGGRGFLSGWLYRVAHRVAIQANIAAARRRTHERQAGELAATKTPIAGPAEPDGLLSTLHEEIARLPKKYRLPILLCDLEGVPQAQAAEQLHRSERTLRRQLAEARDRLKARLTRRGLAPDGASLGVTFLRERRAIPSAWGVATVRAALHTINPAVINGSVSAAAHALTHEVLKTMLIQKLTLSAAALLSAGLMVCVASAALSTRGDETEKKVNAPAEPVAQRADSIPALRPRPEIDPLDAVGMFPVRGRVLNLDGQPVAKAEIYVHHYSFDLMATARGGISFPHYQSSRVAASDDEGGFHFELDKSANDFPYRDYPVWHEAMIAAVAPGYGPSWISAKSLLKGGATTLRLVPDDVPIRGRVVDPQGRPIAGVIVNARKLVEPDKGADKDAILASGVGDFGRLASFYNGPTWLGTQGTWMTDEEGQFEIGGIGRDRIIGLEFRKSTLATTFLYAMARNSLTPTKPSPRSRRPTNGMMNGLPPNLPLVDATFEHVVGPTKPISGVVRSKETGQPLEGVRVIGTESATWTDVWSLTDAQGRFRLIGLPKGKTYEVRAAPRPGIDPFLGTSITIADTEGLKPIETTLELPKGVIVTARLVDKTTRHPVRAKHFRYQNLLTNRNEGHVLLSSSGIVDPTCRLTVPPGEGMIYASVRGSNLLYTRARLREADKERGLGGPEDKETLTIPLNGYQAYRIIDIPADATSFSVDLDLVRGLTRKGRLVGPDGKPVTGAQCYGVNSTWGYIETLTDDTFEVRGLELGHPRLLAFAHPDLRLVGSATIKDEDLKSDVPLKVQLGPGGTLKGRLVDEDDIPLAGVKLSVVSMGIERLNFPGTPGGLWPDAEGFTTDANGQFEIIGLKPGIKSLIDVQIETRPGTQVNTGGFLRNVVFKQHGEVRDIGKVKVKVVAE